MRKKRIIQTCIRIDCAPNAFISFGSPPERISDALAMKAQHENKKTVQPLPPPLLGTGVAQWTDQIGITCRDGGDLSKEVQREKTKGEKQNNRNAIEN